MDFRELIVQTGKLIGLEDFQPDEENVCHLISDEMTITIEFMEEWGLILMSAPVCQIPQECAEDVRLFRAIAEANFLYKKTWGSTISVNPENDYIHIFRYDRAYDWTPEDLLYVVGRVASGVHSVRKMVSEFGGAKLPEPGDENLVLHASDFIFA